MDTTKIITLHSKIVEEVWKDVENYEGFYQVSNLGRVKSLDRVIPDTRKNIKKISKNRTLRGVILKLPLDSKGYPVVCLSKEGSKITAKVSRLVAMAFIPNNHNLPDVLHGDDNPLNNRQDNLRWGTHQDNMDDKKIRGRVIRTTGETNGRCKLSDLDIQRIRDLWTTEQYSRQQLAEIFSVHRTHIALILRGKFRKTVNYEE